MTMKTYGLSLAWDEYQPGMTFRTIGRTIFEADLIGFLNATGMTEVVFNNVVFQAESNAIKGQLVPGVLAYCFAEGLLIQAVLQGRGLALMEMEQKLLLPVLVGDTIHVEVEVKSVRPTSKGNRGIVESLNHVVNQRGEVTQTYRTVRMIAGREP